VPPPPHEKPDKAEVDRARDFLVQMDKAIRVFRMYDESNDLVAKFLKEVDARRKAYTDVHGDLVVRLRPNAFDYRGELISNMGLDELALALFRQGLTALRVQRDIEVKALYDFLILLSDGLLSEGGDQDDLVTLLWRAQIPGVSYSSVLGYEELDAEEEEQQHDFATSDAVRSTLTESMLSDLGELGEHTTGALAQKAKLLKQERAELTPQVKELIAPLMAETSTDLQLYVLEIIGESLLSPTAAQHFAEAEVEELLSLLLGWLVEAGRIENVSRFIGFLQFITDPQSAPNFHFVQTVNEFIAAGLSGEQLRSLVEGLEGGAAAHVEPLRVVVSVLGRQRKDTLAELIEAAPDESSRTAIDQLLLALCQEDPEFLIDRFRETTGRAVVTDLEVMGAIGVEHARKAVFLRLAEADPQTQALLLQAMADNPELYDERLRGTLSKLGKTGGRMRVSVVEVFCRSNDEKAAAELWRWTQDPDFESWDRVDLIATFRGLMRLSSLERTLAFLEEILDRKSLLRRQALVKLQEAAIEALEENGSGPGIGILKRQGTEGHKWLREPCNAALSRLAAKDRAGRR
jgi:hypothetical protein